ncbi:MAG: FlhC family transcriptional regulator [Steroidobacteraceae bacterium]
MEELHLIDEVQRLAVTLRMIKFEARTSTIRRATQLSDERIRRLYRDQNVSTIQRHRGRSPSSAGQYTRNYAMQLESSILSGVLVKRGLLRGHHAKHWLCGESGYAQCFCDAYEEYLPMAYGAALSFEQAWYFAYKLAAHEELYLQYCSRCKGHFVRDAATVLRHRCPLCQLRECSALGAC